MPRVRLEFDGVSRGAVKAAHDTRTAIRQVGDESDRTTRRASRGFRDSQKDLDRFSRGAIAGSGAFRSFGRSIAFASASFLGGVGFIAVVRQSISRASDLHEELNKVDVVFKDSARSVRSWSKDSAFGFGLARAEALKFAGTFGNLLTPMGIAPDLAATMSKRLVQLAGDMASFNNASPEEVLLALNSGLTGMVRPLRRYGVFLDQDRIAAEALRLGVVKANVDMGKTTDAATKVEIATAKLTAARKKYGEGTTQVAAAEVALHGAERALSAELGGRVPKLTAAQKAQATYAIILKDTANAQGDFARTSDGLANQQRILRAELINLQEAAGTALMPTILRLVRGITSYLKTLEEGGSRHEAFIRQLHTVGNVARSVAGAIRLIAGAAVRVVNVMGGWKNAFELILTLFIANKFLKLAQAIKASRVAMILLGQQSVVTSGTVVAGAEAEAVAMNAPIGRVATLRKALVGLAASPFSIAVAVIVTAFYGNKLAKALIGDSGSGPFGLGDATAGGPGDLAPVKRNGVWIDPTTGKPVPNQKAAEAWARAHTTGYHGQRSFTPSVGAGGPSPEDTRSYGAGVTYTGQHLTHQTRGLPGYPAVDVMGHPGTPVLAPENGSVIRHSGHPPSEAPPEGQGGPWGLSLYFLGASGTTYYMTHLMWVAPLGRYRRGAKIGTIGNYPGGADHVHIGVHRGSGSVTPTAPDTGGGGGGGGGGLTVGSSSSPAAHKASDKPDPAELQAARRTAAFVEQAVGGVVSPTLRKRLRTRADELNEALQHVANEGELRKLQARLKKLTEDLEAAVKLGQATVIARRSAKALATQINRLPDEMAKDVRAKMKVVQKELADVTTAGQLARVKRQMDAIAKAVADAIDKLRTIVGQRQDAFGTAFGRVADKMLSIFDAQTQKLIDKARARVAEFGFEIGVGEETPAERALRERDAVRSAQEIASAVAAAQAAVDKAAKDTTSPDFFDTRTAEERAQALIDAQKTLQDALYAEETAGLEKQADAERKAADAALAAEQKRIQDERDLLRERFQNRITEIETNLQNETITAKEAREQLLALMADPAYQTSFGDIGDLMGAAFATGFTDAIDGLTEALNALIDALNELLKATGKTPLRHAEPVKPKPGKSTTPAGHHPAMARGGTVPGQYVGRSDTIVGSLTSGEEVVDRSTAVALRSFLASQAGGGGSSYGPIYVLGTTEREVAIALAKLAGPELDRQIGYRLD
jgi:hypothetical protein